MVRQKFCARKMMKSDINIIIILFFASPNKSLASFNMYYRGKGGKSAKTLTMFMNCQRSNKILR